MKSKNKQKTARKYNFWSRLDLKYVFKIRIIINVRRRHMSKVKPYKLVRKMLLKAGWILDHTSGSHEIYTKDGISCPVKCTKKIFRQEL